MTGKILRLLTVRSFKQGQLVGPTEEGTPQGGPLSPLLSNLMLDVLDRELEKRGHRFVRYADDCNIYVRSQRAGERVMLSIERFLASRLKLTVNKAKSAVAAPPSAEILRLQLHERNTPKTASCATDGGSVQSESTGVNAPDPRPKPRADCQRAIPLSHRMAWVLWLLRNSDGVARARTVDQAAAARHRLETLAARSDEVYRAGQSRCRRGPGSPNCREPTRPVAD
jgi:Reverse transcriptase (RNA-dependent DNA polymerase)